jgi:hypothetical protein
MRITVTPSGDAPMSSKENGRGESLPAALAGTAVLDLMGSSLTLIRFAAAVLLVFAWAGSACADNPPEKPPACVQELGGQTEWYSKGHRHVSLFFANSNLSDDDLAAIRDALIGITKLKKLDLSFTKVTGSTLDQLEELSDLTDLDLGNTLVHDEGLRKLEHLAKLCKLRLNQTYLTEDGLRCLAVNLGSRLTSLDLSNAVVIGRGSKPLPTASIVRILASFNNLQELNLSGMQLGDDDLDLLAKHCRLKRLIISRNSLTDKGMSALEKMTQLIKLDLSGNVGIANDGLKKLGCMKCLVDLNISGTGNPKQPVTNDGLKGLLPQKRELKKLNISNTNTRFNDEVLNCLNRSKLKVLDVSGTGVSNAEMCAIGKLYHLEELHVANTTVDDKGLALLKKLRCLHGIDIDNSKATAAGVTRLAAIMQDVFVTIKMFTALGFQVNPNKVPMVLQNPAVPQVIHAGSR